MSEWFRQIQIMAEEIDRCIQRREDTGLTLRALATKLGYSPFHTTRKFREIAGISLRDYLRLRRLAFALIDLRDSEESILSIALNYGFSSHEAFSRAFKEAYGLSPSSYRERPRPLVLRTKLHAFDRYTLGKEEIGMIHSSEDVKAYFVSIPAHRFLHIKNYQSDGYFDFWAKQDEIPGQDCDTICGLLDSIKGKLDGSDEVIGEFSGQIMGYIQEADGRCPEAYGIRLPHDYAGLVPEQMLMLDIPAGEYIVFEHGPFVFDRRSNSVSERIRQEMESFAIDETEYAFDDEPGRIRYYYHNPERFMKRVLPVRKK